MKATINESRALQALIWGNDGHKRVFEMSDGGEKKKKKRIFSQIFPSKFSAALQLALLAQNRMSNCWMRGSVWLTFTLQTNISALKV